MLGEIDVCSMFRIVASTVHKSGIDAMGTRIFKSSTLHNLLHTVHYGNVSRRLVLGFSLPVVRASASSGHFSGANGSEASRVVLNRMSMFCRQYQNLAGPVATSGIIQVLQVERKQINLSISSLSQAHKPCSRAESNG